VKKVWRIEGFDSTERIYERTLDIRISDKQMIGLLQRLVCRHLSEDEIVGSSLRRNQTGYLAHLETRTDFALGRHYIMAGDNPHYVASIIDLESASLGK
jgi:hypothetical protein